jgi:hypothetical protein
MNIQTAARPRRWLPRPRSGGGLSPPVAEWSAGGAERRHNRRHWAAFVDGDGRWRGGYGPAGHPSTSLRTDHKGSPLRRRYNRSVPRHPDLVAAVACPRRWWSGAPEAWNGATTAVAGRRSLMETAGGETVMALRAIGDHKGSPLRRRHNHSVPGHPDLVAAAARRGPCRRL